MMPLCDQPCLESRFESRQIPRGSIRIASIARTSRPEIRRRRSRSKGSLANDEKKLKKVVRVQEDSAKISTGFLIQTVEPMEHYHHLD